MSRSIAESINIIIPWSNLSNIGNSLPAKLTILAPLVGYLVIYNQAIAEFFFLESNTELSLDGKPSLLIMFQDLKLSFLYFGLLFFGIGMIIFAFFAPTNIKRYRSSEEFVLAMEAAQTEWLIIDNFSRVGNAAMEESDYNGNTENYGKVSLSFTDDTLFQLEAILDYAGHNAFLDEHEETDGLDEAELDTLEEDSGFYNMMGNINTDRVLDCILSKRRVDRALWHGAIDAIAQKRARDVFYMTYTYDEWSKFGSRLSCAFFFSLGGTLLTIPTIITSIEIILQVANSQSFKQSIELIGS